MAGTKAPNTIKAADRPVGRLSFAQPMFGSFGAPIWLHDHIHESPIQLHQHDFVEVALIRHGHADHHTVRGSQPIDAGHVLVIHPGQWHGYAETRALRLTNCCLSSELFSRELAWIHRDQRLTALFPGPTPRDDRERRMAHQGIRAVHFTGTALVAVQECFTELQRLCTAGRAGERRGELVARVLLLLEAIADHRDFATATAPFDPRVRTSTEAMSADIAHPWSLEALAAHSGASTSHLLRLFRRHLGNSPIDWLAERRAERLALLLITTDRPIADLGPEVGWSDPSYCARRFRASFGVAPDLYRRQHGFRSM